MESLEEKRDKEANEYMEINDFMSALRVSGREGQIYTNEIVEGWCINSFKVGWDACQKEMEAELNSLREYQTHIYDYVQCSNNTSPKFLGYHVAEALVLDHKESKEEIKRLGEKVEEMRGALEKCAQFKEEWTNTYGIRQKSRPACSIEARELLTKLQEYENQQPKGEQK